MKIHLVILFLFTIFSTYSQKKFSFELFNPKKVGVSYHNGSENSFLFDDPDYNYDTKILKGNIYYDLGSWKTINFNFIISPQIRILKHQLLNKWFVTTDIPDFEEKRIRFTKPKTMYLYGFQLAIEMNKKIYKRIGVFASLNVGLAGIDTETERLAQGFTFIENGVFGFSFNNLEKINFYIGTNIGHVSNFNLLTPNSGYNQLGIEIGVNFELK